MPIHLPFLLGRAQILPCPNGIDLQSNISTTSTGLVGLCPLWPLLGWRLSTKILTFSVPNEFGFISYEQLNPIRTHSSLTPFSQPWRSTATQLLDVIRSTSASSVPTCLFSFALTHMSTPHHHVGPQAAIKGDLPFPSLKPFSWPSRLSRNFMGKTQPKKLQTEQNWKIIFFTKIYSHTDNHGRTKMRSLCPTGEGPSQKTHNQEVSINFKVKCPRHPSL